jgi:Na+/H+ antiporter NhaD/arsenite permease-like protein
MNLLALGALSMKKGVVMILALSTVLPAWWMLLPFLMQLLAIAMLPFLATHWWEGNYPKVAACLGGITLCYYLAVLGDHHHPVEALEEYLSFIILMAALYVVAGGIHISVPEGADPRINTLFLLLGAILANLIGTTGASMLLIRPWLRMNKARMAGFHTVFFIFIVSNVGGCLTPIGDPPLFLGFLKGVPFFWTLTSLFLPWLFVIALLAIIFFLIDRRSHLKTAAERAAAGAGWGVEGMANLVPLVMILGAVFLPAPWRELIMCVAALLSWRLTPQEVHLKNEFNAEPIKEVAWLFLGIFLTMMPALDYLEHYAKELARTIGMDSHHFYYFTGILSSLLDNAPTYLSLLSVEMGLQGGSVNNPHDVLQVALHDPAHLIAISLGAVFFGAMTYIGNGPNFMVKSIASSSGVKTPSFFGYLFGYSLPILLPLLVLVGWIFLR